MSTTSPHAPRTVILAAVDASSHSDAVLAVAAKLSRAVHSPDVQLVHVLEPMVGQGELVTTHDISMTELIESARLLLEETRKRLQSFYPGTIGTHVGMGEAADEIVLLSKKLDAEYVVVGSHGRKGLQRLLLGSVAERVVRQCDRTVVVARDPRPMAQPSVTSPGEAHHGQTSTRLER